MATVTYVAFDGAQRSVDVPLGWSVMEGAKKNGVEGIDADCGGGCSCATCHVYIDDAWRARVGEASTIERATLEFAENVAPESRLSCQIRMREELDGLLVRMPESQR